MDKRSIEYNSETGNVVILNKDSGIPVGDYVHVVRDEVRKYILYLIKDFEYMMYGHIRDYVESRYGKKETTVNEILKDLENRRMISTHYLESHKYAMLSKRGKCITSGDPDAQPLRKPNIHELMRQAYFTEGCKVWYDMEFTDFRNLNRYLELYKSIRNKLCYKEFYDMKDKEGEGLYKVIMYFLQREEKDFNRRFIRPGRCLEWEDIKKMRGMSRSGVRDYIEHLSRAPYFSASEYIDEQICLLENYLHLSKKERTRAERDELSTLQNRDIYYLGMNEDRYLYFLLLDFRLNQEQIKKAILSVDKCIGRMHQYVPGKYYCFNFYVATNCDERSNEVSNMLQTIESKFREVNQKMMAEFDDKENERFSIWKWAENRYRYKNMAFYLNKTHVFNLKIKEYFEANKKCSNGSKNKIQ